MGKADEANHHSRNADSKRFGEKTKTNPGCDRHPNLQMEAATSMTSAGRIFDYVCPVPSCRRHYDGARYFEEVEVPFSNRKDAAQIQLSVVASVSRLPSSGVDS